MPKSTAINGGAVAAAGAAILALVVAFGVPAFWDADPSSAWVWSLGGMTAFAMVVGWAINKRMAGLIIDNRNRVSLSKLQALAWSLMVLSALATGVIFRIRLGFADPVDITLPQELLAAMGLSAASLVAAPMILSVKANQPDASAQAATAADQLNDDDGHAVGTVYARATPDQASWLDLFRGDDAGNAASPDLSKMQQFLITAVVLLVYASAIWKALAGPEYVTDESNAAAFFSGFPAFSTSMLWLIGISHAGYIAYKAAPHTASAPNPAVVAGAAAAKADAGQPAAGQAAIGNALNAAAGAPENAAAAPAAKT